VTLYHVSSSDVFQLINQRDFAKEKYEEQLENWILKNPDILTEGEKILFIKREKVLEKSEDLLGIDEECNTVVIELKRGRTPRVIIAQALEYAARTYKMDYFELDKIARKFFAETEEPYNDLHEAFCDYFEDINLDEFKTQINKKQRIILVAQDISEDVLKTADYLRVNGLDITCIAFRYYKEGELVIVDLDIDVRSSIEDQADTPARRVISDTEKFLIAVRERILDLHSDKIHYATRKPNRVVGFTLDQERNLSVGLSLKTNGDLIYSCELKFKDLNKNKILSEKIRNTFEKYGETLHFRDKKNETLQLYSIHKWDYHYIEDEDFLNETVDVLNKLLSTIQMENA